MGKNKEKKKSSEVSDKLQGMFTMKNTKTDPSGSYTGVPVNPYEQPVQDADDL